MMECNNSSVSCYIYLQLSSIETNCCTEGLINTCSLSNLLEEKMEGIKKVAKSAPCKHELEHYSQNIQPLTEVADVVQFWIEAEKSYPLLSSLALDIQFQGDLLW